MNNKKLQNPELKKLRKMYWEIIYFTISISNVNTVTLNQLTPAKHLGQDKI